MANQKVFCNVPWTNLHVYWDGSYGVCCSERSKFSDLPNHNLKSMTVDKWYSSDVMQDVRSKLLGDDRLEQCSSCYGAEAVGYESRRIRENFKTVIFTEAAFERSYLQSPWVDRFESKQSAMPIDWHVDFGNECNLACKMCNPKASSTIAAHMRRHNKWTGPVKTSWTSDEQAWQNFLTSIDRSPIRRIHVMGGEPLLIPRYMDMIDYLLEKGRTEISISLVTNATLLNRAFVEKIRKFSSCDIEISLETVDLANNYIRQGSDVEVILDRIRMVRELQDDRLQLVLRTAPQLLSAQRYADLIRYAWNNQLIIEGIPLTRPRFMAIDVLPQAIRHALIPSLVELRSEIGSKIQFKQIQNGRSRGTLAEKLARECDAIIKMLKTPEPDNVQELRKELVQHLQFWDNRYGLDGRKLYDFLEGWGYAL